MSDITVTPPPVTVTVPQRPMWLPDTKGFLAIALIAMFLVALLIVSFKGVPENETVKTLLTTMVGALIVQMKEVYGYYLGSSESSAAANSRQQEIVKLALPQQPAPPDNNGATKK